MSSGQPADAPGPSEEARERERRFLVHDASIVEGQSWKLITQAYVPAHSGNAVRIRIVQHLEEDPDRGGEEVWVGETAYLAVKGPRVDGERWEEEFELKDLDEAKRFVADAPYVIQKRRYSFVDDQGSVDQRATWEVDIFLGRNSPLVIAELEGKGDWIWDIPRPGWALREVTHDERYNNEQLAEHPISQWAAEWAANQNDIVDDDIDWLGE